MIKSPDLFVDSPNAVVSLDWPKDYEQQFWREYPLKIAKAAAMKALGKARKKGIVWRVIIDGLRRYKVWLQGPGWRPPAKHPATWVNGECWHDELPTTDAPRNNGGNAFARLAAQAVMNEGDDHDDESDDGRRRGDEQRTLPHP
ncbi:MAG: hypothetical protein Q7S17_10005 [Xanthobacteraceae bacterium]|nr:hypothetical protein [Xanthobacteraceae bacterium]